MKTGTYIQRYPGMLATLMLAVSLLILLAGCDEIDGGTIQNSVTLPTDSVMNFNCENEGVFPDDCVLDNPANPYAASIVSDDTKFGLSDDAPSAKARYYVWATALARQPTGEHQYQTALALHQVYGESGSSTTREQALKAYRATLDEFFLSTQFIGPFGPNNAFFPVSIKDQIGLNMVEPAEAGVPALYSDTVDALSDLGEWGYVYDQDNQILTIAR